MLPDAVPVTLPVSLMTHAAVLSEPSGLPAVPAAHAVASVSTESNKSESVTTSVPWKPLLKVYGHHLIHHKVESMHIHLS